MLKKLPADTKEILLAEILGKSKEFILAHPDTKLTTGQKLKLKKMKQKLSEGLPLAYVLGYRWFRGEKFEVNKNVLIPRPETELLVDFASSWAKKHKPAIVADIGTGSGAIIISLAKVLKNSRASFFGVDISLKALENAKRNAKSILGEKSATSLKFIKGNLAELLEKSFVSARFSNILLCANLPYLSKKELREPSIQSEPQLALYGGKNSFNLIASLIKQLGRMQKEYKSNFKNSAIFLEINYNQPGVAKRTIKKFLPEARIEIYKDLAGWPRVAAVYFI